LLLPAQTNSKGKLVIEQIGLKPEFAGFKQNGGYYEENDWLYPFLDCHRNDNHAVHYEWNPGYMYYYTLFGAWLQLVL
jgi:hypothetical protein